MKLEKIKKIKEIRNYFNEKNMNLLKQTINELDAFEAADIIEVLEPEKQVAVFRLMAKEKALEVFEHIDTYVQQELLQNFTDENAIEIFESLEPDDRIRLMDELPAGVAKRLLESLSQAEKEMTLLLLGYEAGTAGNIMTPKYVRLRKDFTVEEALDKIKSSGEDVETIYQLYVTNETRKLEGVVSLKDLVMADKKTLISDIMKEDPTKVKTDTKKEEVAEILRDSGLLSLPVVDTENRLVGIITIDDAMEILKEQSKEEAYNKVGFLDISNKENKRSSVLISGSLIQVLKVRVPFLIITLIGGMIAGGIMEQFEDILATITAVAFFVPVVMDMGGNVGTQSSTIFTRALVLGHINFKKFLKHWGREILIGISMGIILGIGGGVIAALWQGQVELGIVVGFALLCTITIATTLGFAVPFVLVKLGFDQAAGADPIITTIKDFTGLIIYFLLVSHLLM